MNISSAAFELSAPDLKSCPAASLPEFAFIGRSNVGKSTLLNRITKKRDLARVSDTPGFTTTINFYNVNKRFRLVDLPGYGFARASKVARDRFGSMIEGYVLHRENLACVFVLVDSSIPPQAVDLDFVRWIGEAGKPFALVFTKADKAKGDSALALVEKFMRTIADWFVEPPLIFTTAANDPKGVRELQEVISQAAEETGKEIE
jgi:GTP-binding protein